MNKQERLDREAARMVGVIEKIIETEQQKRYLPKAGSELDSDSEDEPMDDIPEVDETEL